MHELLQLFMHLTSGLCSKIFHLLAVPAHTPWPEFEIENECEGNYDSDSCDENNPKSLVMQKHGKPDAMTQSWMDHFEVLYLYFVFFNCNISLVLVLYQSLFSWLLPVCRLMLITNVGLLFKSASQEHQSKC
jgi:hypothetical protein